MAAEPTIPADPLALRARVHAWAAAVSDLAAPGAAAARPLVAAWDRYRAAWWALPDAVRLAAEGAFLAKHPKCPMADLRPCPLARRALELTRAEGAAA